MSEPRAGDGRIGRRAFLGVLALGAVAGGPGADAQQPARLPRVGVLNIGRRGVPHDVFEQGLRDLGWINGQTVVLEFRPKVARNGCPRLSTSCSAYR